LLFSYPTRVSLGNPEAYTPVYIKRRAYLPSNRASSFQLQQPGLSKSAIAKWPSVTDKTVVKAVAWYGCIVIQKARELLTYGIREDNAWRALLRPMLSAWETKCIK
jgi:hypothetical protein